VSGTGTDIVVVPAAAPRHVEHDSPPTLSELTERYIDLAVGLKQGLDRVEAAQGASSAEVEAALAAVGAARAELHDLTAALKAESAQRDRFYAALVSAVERRWILVLVSFASGFGLQAAVRLVEILVPALAGKGAP
jgi:hypothetical protein